MDGDAQIIAMSRGQDHPLHIVPIAWSMKAVRERFGDDIHEGDVFLHNDPYTGGTHLNDVAMIYVGGPEMAPHTPQRSLLDPPFLFPVVRAHWGDVGGMSPGSLSGRVTEIYQEGVRIPPIRIYERGRPNQAALELIFANMRGPREREGDFRAMLGTCRKAAERVEALLARYGRPTLQAAIAELLDRAERRMRQRIAALPPGRYAYEAYLEGGRERLEPLRVRATVTVAGDSILVDLAGTSPQTAGPTNVGPAMAPTGAFTIFKAFLDPGADVNSGAFRPLTVLAPEGTVVNARRPAPCGGMVEVKYCVESAVMGALARAMSGGVTGDLKGGGNHCYVGGPTPAGDGTFIFYEYPAAGTGAWDGGDGNNAVRAFTESDITTIQPVEAIEQKYPLRVESCALRAGSGGPGRWRGGLGLVREVRVLAPDAQLSVLAEKGVLPPYGVCGGAAGATNRFYVRRGAGTIEPSPLPGKVSGFPLAVGDLVVMETSGGGGYGDPLDRDPADVARDVEEGAIDAETARDAYGVVLDGTGVNAPATQARRADLRAARVVVELHPTDRLDETGTSGIVLSRAAAERLAARDGTILELVDPAGAPLRLWFSAMHDGPDGRALVSEETLSMLALAPGSRVGIRALVHLRS
jgi:N-methylhydantoinase B